MKRRNSITDVPGLRVGHAQDDEALTGCTVILCEKGAVGGVDQRGGAPGTRETDLLEPVNAVEKVHAVLLAGGSAFGLDAASGVMRYLEEKGIGFNTGVARVPIVPAAILYDLAIGRADIRPDAEMGYRAAASASAQDNTQVVQEVCGFRWKVEQFHRETKQLTGIEGCQCRRARIVRNHIGCAVLVWIRLKQVARETKQTVYQVKHGLLSEYLRQQLKSPSIQMSLA